MECVLTDRQDRVLTITLNRPERLNAVTAELFADLAEACVEAADPSVKAVILTGSGRGFCAGADVTAPRLTMEPGSRRQRRFFNPAIVELAGLEKPVLAAVNGAAVGAGLSLAAAADIRIASERARLACGFVDVGLAPDTGTSYFLERNLGYSAAFYFLTTGQTLTGEQALAAGLVNELVPHDRLLERTQELAAALAAKPGIGVAATKALLQRAATSSLVDQLEAESTTYDRTTNHPERLAARAAMAEKLANARRPV